MREHICIRRPEWVAGTSEKPEIGFFIQTAQGRKPVPWNQIAPGETVWMKWNGGPVVAKAMVMGVRQFADCSRARLRQVISEFEPHGLESYLRSLPPHFSAVMVYLDEERWLDEPITVAPRRNWASWIVLPDAGARKSWFTAPKLTRRAKPDPRGPRTAGPALRFLVFRRDNFTCQYCGRKAPEVTLQVDHIIPWAEGGAAVLENLRTACTECTSDAGSGLSMVGPTGARVWQSTWRTHFSTL